MKSLIFLLLLSISATPDTDIAEKENDLQVIVSAVEQFSKSADEKNVNQMDVVLHKDFRAIVNRLFGNEDVAVMDKTLYLDLLEQGKIGGDTRSVYIESIQFEGNNALVKATLDGKALKFHTFIQLVKETSGDWKVISDMPNIEKK